jgi:ribosome-associated heat shock protein Hsp15
MPSRRSVDDEDELGQAGRQRLDKWLVYARFVKTREIAHRLVERGHVRINSERTKKPDRSVTIDDVLTLALPHGTFVVRVTSLAERRGSPRDAQALYVLISEMKGE